MKVKVEKATKEKVAVLGAEKWPVWESEPSRFDWEYSTDETCYVLEGKVVVETPEGNVEFGAGDIVFFPKGLKCVWNVKERVKKHYKLG